jgi:hypothetical protein
MKRWASIFLTAISLCAVSASVSAQRYLPGQRGLQLTLGTVNSFAGDFHCTAAYSVYTRSANRWVFGAGYLEKRYDYRKTSIPQSQFTAEAGYFLKFLSDRSKTFFLSAGASALAGYETVNWNSKLLYDGATLRNGDGLIYGAAITLEAEVFLTNEVILLGNIRERFMPGSSVGRFHFQPAIGIKYIIN